jgi:hypothetical protein
MIPSPDLLQISRPSLALTTCSQRVVVLGGGGGGAGSPHGAGGFSKYQSAAAEQSFFRESNVDLCMQAMHGIHKACHALEDFAIPKNKRVLRTSFREDLSWPNLLTKKLCFL